MPMAANFSRNGASTAAVPVGGLNCSRKLRYSEKRVVNASFSNSGQSTAGAAGGAGLPMNADKGCSLYPAWTFLTLSMSAGLKSCVR
jgi:hypothetical protein